MARWQRALWIVACSSAGCGARTDLELPLSVGSDACADCTVPACGNGNRDPDEECDLGSGNEDRPALLLTQATLYRPVMPVDRARGAGAFYDYTSESSHTGFEGATLSALFAYRNIETERFDIVMHHGIDEDATGITLEHGLVDMTIEELPSTATIALADEDNELFMTTSSQAEGFWEFWRNTDGGIVGPLPFPGNWSVDFTIALIEGIDAWHYVDTDGKDIVLDPRSVAVLTAFDSPAACRTDCTLPRCGDGIVDGGEACDDGNTTGGDGCASDCRSLGGD